MTLPSDNETSRVAIIWQSGTTLHRTVGHLIPAYHSPGALAVMFDHNTIVFISRDSILSMQLSPDGERCARFADPPDPPDPPVVTGHHPILAVIACVAAWSAICTRALISRVTRA